MNSSKGKKFLQVNNIAANMYWRERLGNLEPVPLFEGYNNSFEKGRAIKPGLAKTKKGFNQLINLSTTEEGKHIVLISALAVLFNKYYGTADVLLFSPAIGNMKNSIPIRIKVNPQLTFQELLMTSKPLILQDFIHGDYPLSKILEACKRDISDCPKIGFVLKGLQDLILTEGIDFDLLFTVELKERISIKLDYNPEKFSTGLIKEITNRYLLILEKLLNEPTTEIGLLEALTDKERYQILEVFNNTDIPYPKKETIVSLFEEKAKKVPNNTAIRFGDKGLTYLELTDKINRIAAYLQNELDVKKGDLVGLMLDRELDLIPMIYGILKVGAVYVPLNPTFPKERIKSIEEEAEFKVVISRAVFLSSEVIFTADVLDLDKVGNSIQNYSSVFVDADLSSSDLAYIIFTSGSTGQPKGVMVEHSAVINRICWMQNQYPIDERDILVQKTPITFDVSIWELFWWSFTGASLFVLKPSVEKDPQKLAEVILEQKITIIHFVPSMLSAFLRFASKRKANWDFSKLRHVFASGEALKPNHLKLFKKYFDPKTTLINLYGPTEATVDVSYHNCDLNKEYSNVPIGKPIQNIKLYIVNREHKLVPIGISGELVIAGDGLARGYLNKKQLTNAKFINSVFGVKERIYKTGDLARWLPNGDIQFLGRIDNQVKLRGYRIELGEIETILLKHEGVHECAIDVRGDDEEKYLVAYYVPKVVMKEEELRDYLLSFLPEYMIPSFFVPLEMLPINTNGKLNKSLLPKPAISKEEIFILPSNEVESKVLRVWAQVLDFTENEISVRANFFHLGGHSLKIIEIINKIDEEFDVMIPFNDFFENPTIELLSELIKTQLWLEGKTRSKKINKKITI